MSENATRHLTSSYGYAHFSKITMNSWMLYPSLLFTHPIHIVLNEGESIFIPSKWWHWVRTEPNSYAINFWFNGKEGLPDKPENAGFVPVDGLAPEPCHTPFFENQSFPAVAS